MPERAPTPDEPPVRPRDWLVLVDGARTKAWLRWIRKGDAAKAGLVAMVERRSWARASRPARPLAGAGERPRKPEFSMQHGQALMLDADETDRTESRPNGFFRMAKRLNSQAKRRGQGGKGDRTGQGPRIGHLDSLGGVVREMGAVYREVRTGTTKPDLGCKLVYIEIGATAR